MASILFFTLVLWLIGHGPVDGAPGEPTGTSWKKLVRLTKPPLRKFAEEGGHLIILLDASYSISNTDWALMKETAKQIFVLFEAQPTSVSIYSFSDTVNVICEENCNEKAGDEYRFLGAKRDPKSTNTHLALLQAREKLGSKSGKKTLLIFTDGEPNNPQETLQQANQAKAEQIRVYVLGFGNVDKEFVASLASEDSYIFGTLKDIFNAVSAEANSKPGYEPDQIWIEAEWSSNMAVEPNREKLIIPLEVTNNREEEIPKGTTFVFTEVRRGGVGNHISAPSHTLQGPIAPGGKYRFDMTVTLKLFNGEGKGYLVFPEHIQFRMKDPQKREIHGVIELPAWLFRNNVIHRLSEMKGKERDVHLLLFGMFGAGKSYTGNLLLKALQTPDSENTLTEEFTVGGGQVPETALLYYTKVQSSDNVPLSICDIPGLDEQNFKDNYLELVLAGRVSLNSKGSDGASVIADKKWTKKAEFPIDVVLVVVKHEISAVDPSNAAFDKLKSLMRSIKQDYSIPLVVAVTHMAKVPVEDWQDKLTKISQVLGIDVQLVYPIAIYPTPTHEPRFETEMQVYNILEKVVDQAKVRWKRKNADQNLNDAVLKIIPKEEL